MPLEDVKTIDIALADAEGNPQLVITDSGQTRDPDQRVELLLAKLTTYLRYILSGEGTGLLSKVPPCGIAAVGLGVSGWR